MPLDLDKVFAPETIQVLGNLPVEDLTHSYSDKRKGSDGNPIPFDGITRMLAELRTDVEQWHQQEYGIEMDTFNLGERAKAVKNRFYQDTRFQRAFSLLGLNQEDMEKAKIPWWNEVAAGELDYKLTKPGVHVQFGPRHSLETQLMREGVEIPVQNVSVGSLVLIENSLFLGLRGGASYPNTYHINAGALKAEDSFKTGKSSVYDMFVKHELTPEFGLTQQDLQSTTLLSRIDDKVIDKGPMYVFLVKPNLTEQQVYEKWSSNLDQDKAEHNQLVSIEANPDSVNTFIRATYKGQVENRSRSNNERLLLHPGALALASFSGMSPAELREFYREGVW